MASSGSSRPGAELRFAPGVPSEVQDPIQAEHFRQEGLRLYQALK